MKEHKKVILTAVFISIIISMILDLLTPDLWTMIYFQQHGEGLLLKYGILGIVLALILAYVFKKEKIGKGVK